MREHQLDASGLQVVSQDRDSGVAPSDENSIAKIIGGIEDLDVRAAVFRKLIWAGPEWRLTHGLSLTGKYSGNRRRRRRHQALIDAAELYRLARMERFGARQQRHFLRA